MSNLICIKTFANRMEAELAKSLLESNGIKASVSADDAGGMYSGIELSSGGVKLFVLEDNAAAALKLMEDA